MQTGCIAKKPKILFIQPSQISDDGLIWKSRMPWLPRLSLPQIAAITPPRFDTKIVDEYLEEINFEEDADLVAISATTVQAPRAYQIAAEFKKHGKKTIIGGMHASLLPDEAQKYADSVFIGEAEGLWHTVLEDIINGDLQNRYENSSKMIDINHLPFPDFSKMDLSKYKVPYRPVQTTRGCPHNCGYCSVTKFFGKSYRHRDIKEVVEEIKRHNTKRIFFVDDNIAANPKRAKELFKALIPLNIKWTSQCCMSIAYDDELMQLAKESGCNVLMIGLESLSAKSLGSVNKSINKVEDYLYVIDKIHKYGISTGCFMIFGFDHDNESVFEKTADFVDKANIDYPCYWILTPYPNTPLYNQLNSEGRIFERDWSKYDCSHAVFRPSLMTPKALEDGYQYAYKRAYSTPSIIKRMFSLTGSSLSMANRLILKGDLGLTLGISYLFQHGTIRGHHPMMG